MVVPPSSPQTTSRCGSHHWYVPPVVALLKIDDITETNEFIDDSEAVRQELLTQDEIADLRAQGATVQDIMQAQLQRHERFKLKTEFSKEKWRKRKEKKLVYYAPQD